MNSNFVNNLKEKMESSISEMDDYASTDSARMYLQDIKRYPLITQEDEQELGQIIQSLKNTKLLTISNVRNVESYSLNTKLLFSSLINNETYNSVIDSLLKLYSVINVHENNTAEELIKYKRISSSLDRALDKDELKNYFNIDANYYIDESNLPKAVNDFIAFKYAYNKFFESNLRLVISVVKRHRSKVDFLELVNEGNIGLLRAIQKYDPSLGFKFSTYAVSWIEQYVERAISKYTAVIRVPNSFRRELAKFITDVDALKQEMQRELTIDEISEKLNISAKKINEFYTNIYETVSLDKPIGEDGDVSLLDMIAQDDSIDDILSSQLLIDDINELLECLNEKESEVIKLRFGIGVDHALSLNDIAKLLSVSQSRIRQIEARAIIKMRRYGRTGKAKLLQYYVK